MKRDRCLTVMVRHPEPGKVKTRLARTLGDDVAAGIYSCFIADLIEALAPGNYSLFLFFTPVEKEAEIRRRFEGGFCFIPQRGEGLGERMANVFGDCFGRGAAAAVLIGSDCPDLTADVIEGAFGVLEGGKDAVIGRAFDGGYYLIGFRSATFDPAVFEGMPWGEETVFGKTLERLRARGCRIHLAPEWHDIDTAEDLAALRERHAHGPFRRSRTMTFLAGC
jgi:rSAM/selenodomain-associated transferase 1